MNRILFILPALLAFSCISVSTESGTVSEPDVKVSMRFSGTPMSSVTRSTDDSAIRSGNIRMALENSIFVAGGPFADDGCTVTCPPGRYLAYASANVPGTEYAMLSSLDTLSVPCSLFPETLPMSWKGDITVPSGTESYTVPEIGLTRAAARIRFSVEVSDAVPDIELKEVVLCSLPSRTYLFSPSSPSPRYDSDPFPVSDPTAFSGLFYMGENLAGTVTEITSQRRKNEENAPEGASYILIRAVSGNRVLGYRVYLGADNTSDFNVRRNTEYRLSIVVNGEDSIDTRLTSYTLSVTDTFGSECVGEWSTLSPASLKVVIGEDPEMDFSCRTEILSGDADAFLVCGEETPQESDAYPGSNSFPIVYSPGLFTSANSELRYRVKVTDSDGYSSVKTFSHRFANRAEVYCTLPSESVPGGSVSFSGVLAREVKDPVMGIYRAAVLDSEYTVTASPAFGYVFSGWYSDPERTVRISTSPVLVLTAHSPIERVYALFTYTSDRIYYITSDGNTADIDGTAFGRCNVDENTYSDGRGTILFDGDLEEIGESAFQNCTNLVGITLPQTLSAIGRYAFRGCSSLRSVALPAEVVRIEEGTFSGCSSLESVSVPAGLRYIGDSAFYCCFSLASADLGNVESISDSAFCRCTLLGDVDLGSASSIGDWAFAYCSSLSEVSAPAAVTLGLFAFESCGALRHAETGPSLSEIGSGTFAYCPELRSVRMASPAPPYILPHASSTRIFESCPKLERIEVPPSSLSSYRSAWSDYSSLIFPGVGF